jgi:hypothetical protein
LQFSSLISAVSGKNESIELSAVLTDTSVPEWQIGKRR